MVRNSGLIKGKPNERRVGLRVGGGRLFGGKFGFWARKMRMGRASHRGRGGHRGGLGVGGQILSVVAWASGREIGRNRKSIAQRSRGCGRLFGGQLWFLGENDSGIVPRRGTFPPGSPSNEREQSATHPRRVLAFHGTGGEACHDPVLEDHDQDDQRNCHHHGSRHDRTPGLFIGCCTTKL
jgi:hypothetical protein